jgi:Ricin-type beta-trefoil lectin domain
MMDRRWSGVAVETELWIFPEERAVTNQMRRTKMKTLRWFLTSCNNTQNESVVSHSLTAYSWMSAVLTLLLLTASARPARALALQVNSNAPYVCVAVEGGSTTNGTPVIAYSCSGAFDQEWNYLEGQLIGGTGDKCLDVADNGTAPGTLVDYYTCHGSQNQQWLIKAGEGGTTAIVGVQSGLCLDSSGGPSEGGGTQLIINTCSGATSQNWNVRRTLFELNTAAPYLCIAVNNAETVSGTAVIATSCSIAFQDEWDYNYGTLDGIGTANPGTGEKYKCLTATGKTSGSTVEISSCTATLKDTQLWTIENGVQLGLPTSTLIVGVNGLCIDSQGGPSVGGGTQLIIDTCTGATSQNWIVR